MKILEKVFQNMFKKDLICQIVKWQELYQWIIDSVEDNELEGEIMKEFVGLRPKMYSFWKDNKNEGIKEQKVVPLNVKSSLMTVNDTEKWNKNEIKV